MKKKEEIQHYNVSLAQATKSFPVIQYARCIDADRRPANHVGDWPTEGVIYPIKIMKSKVYGAPLVYILGFEGEAPFYNAFAPERFEPVMDIFLN